MISGVSGLGAYQALTGNQCVRPHKDDLFQKIDSDGSSGIDKAEFSDFAKMMSEHSGLEIDTEKVFADYDQDGDGNLSETELDTFRKENAPPPPPPGSMMGRPGVEETRQALSDLFDSLDSNADGSIDKDEFSALLDQLAPGGTGAGGTSTSGSIEDLLANFDQDGDDSLNSDELSTFLQNLAPPQPPPGLMQQAAAAYGRQGRDADN